MFQLNEQEFEVWRSQIATSKPKLKKAIRYRPYAFTEHGVAMLSSVLNSKRAIQVNIYIIKAFVKMREIVPNYRQLIGKINEMEQKIIIHDDNIKAIFQAMRYLLMNTVKKSNNHPPVI